MPHPKESQSQNQNLSPNLAFGIVRNFDPFIFFLQILITIVFAAFVITLMYNTKLNFDLARLQGDIQELRSLIGRNEATFDQISDLNRKITIYKSADGMRVNSSNYIESMFLSIPPTVEFNEATVNETKANLKLTAPEAVHVAVFISNVLESGNVNFVIINNASLESSGEYVLDLEIEFIQ